MPIFAFATPACLLDVFSEAQEEEKAFSIELVQPVNAVEDVETRASHRTPPLLLANWATQG